MLLNFQFVLKDSFFKIVSAMLSVLVPVYNTDVRFLASQLSQEGLELGIPFEIRIYDDASDAAFLLLNQTLDQFPGVVYHRLPENVGRSKIRNLLANAAVYDFLVFLDADSAIPEPGFLRRYLRHLDAGKVLYGGRCYADRPPEPGELVLHWRVGHKKEQMDVAFRQKQPYLSFMSNNFLIHRRVFERIGFDEKIKTYGHEDTVFGLILQQNSVPILHLDNPLQHTGLEPVRVFLDKSRTAALNLLPLQQRYPALRTPLLRTFEWLGWVPGARRAFSLLEKPLRGLLLRWDYCPLWVFDLFKLSCLCNGFFRGADNPR